MVGYRQGGYRSSALVRKIIAYLVHARNEYSARSQRLSSLCRLYQVENVSRGQSPTSPLGPIATETRCPRRVRLGLISGHALDGLARQFRANTGIRTVCVSDWLRPRGHQLGWYHNAARRPCPSCCMCSGTLFISIYPHIPSLIFWTYAGCPIPENACAERRKADFGGYPVAFATFCVDGMKFALRLLSKAYPAC
jgi:hypothetical protein